MSTWCLTWQLWSAKWDFIKVSNIGVCEGTLTYVHCHVEGKIPFESSLCINGDFFFCFLGDLCVHNSVDMLLTYLWYCEQIDHVLQEFVHKSINICIKQLWPFEQRFLVIGNIRMVMKCFNIVFLFVWKVHLKYNSAMHGMTMYWTYLLVYLFEKGYSQVLPLLEANQGKFQ